VEGKRGGELKLKMARKASEARKEAQSRSSSSALRRIPPKDNLTSDFSL
jgi:hypothetical protein